jgi:hypothetical protein
VGYFYNPVGKRRPDLPDDYACWLESGPFEKGKTQPPVTVTGKALELAKELGPHWNGTADELEEVATLLAAEYEG